MAAAALAVVVARRSNSYLLKVLLVEAVYEQNVGMF